MSKLKAWRCIVNLTARVQTVSGPRLLEEQIILIIRAGKPGQAEMKIYTLFNGSEFIPHLQGTPVEMTGTEQMQLFM